MFASKFKLKKQIWRKFGNTHTHILMTTGEYATTPLSWENRLRIAADTAQGSF